MLTQSYNYKGYASLRLKLPFYPKDSPKYAKYRQQAMNRITCVNLK